VSEHDGDSEFPAALRAAATDAVARATGNGRAHPPSDFDFDDPTESTKPGFGPGNSARLERDPELPPPALDLPDVRRAGRSARRSRPLTDLEQRVLFLDNDAIWRRLSEGEERFDSVETKIEKLGLDNDANFVALNKTIAESNAVHATERADMAARLERRDARLHAKIERSTPGPVVMALGLLLLAMIAISALYIAHGVHEQQQSQQ
jgi:hypothetical protein